MGCLPMFGVHCFVVQVLHGHRKVGGGGGGGGGEAHPII